MNNTPKTIRIAKRAMLIALFIGFVFPNVSFAQKKGDSKPAWTDYQRRSTKFPKSTYVTGFTAEEVSSLSDQTEVLERLEDAARKQLVESIHVTIKSMTTTQMVTENTVTADLFKQTSVSFSKVSISGLVSDNYFDEKAKTIYAFCYAKKSEVAETYKNTIENKKVEARNNLEAAEAFIISGNNTEALRSFYANMPIFRELEEAQTLTATFMGLTAESGILQIDAINEIKQKTIEKIQLLQKSSNLTLDDAAFFIANGIALQLTDFDAAVRIANFTFEDTQMGSVFAKRFTRSLEQKLVSKKLRVTDQATLAGEPVNYMLSGTYWEEGGKLKLIAVLRNLEDGTPVAGAESVVPISWLSNNGVEYKPANFNNAYADFLKFNQDAVISEGGLIVDVTTNNGGENLIFTQGDTLKLFIKANRECYVRFIYYLADGTKVQMLDNLYIDRDKVNKIYELPDKFIIDAPFGVEALQLNAQTKEFDKLRTIDYYGYRKIVDDMTTLLANTRGFRPVENTDGKAEKRITITTLSKSSTY